MGNKWTTYVGLTLLVLIAIVPLALYRPEDPGLLLWLPDAITDQARTIDQLFYYLLGLTGFLFVGVHAVMIYFMVAYRKGQRSSTPETEGHLGIEITWTVIPTLIMVALGIWTFNIYDNLVNPVVEAGGVHVNVEAQQFSWRFRYPDSDHSIETRNQLVLPKGRPIHLRLESPDVLHSFWIPEFRMKQDVVPGTTVEMYIEEIDQTGIYQLRCAELCGIGHYRMMSDVTVLNQEEFETWHSMEDSGQRREFIRQVSQNE